MQTKNYQGGLVSPQILAYCTPTQLLSTTLHSYSLPSVSSSSARTRRGAISPASYQAWYTLTQLHYTLLYSYRLPCVSSSGPRTSRGPLVLPAIRLVVHPLNYTPLYYIVTVYPVSPQVAPGPDVGH